MKTLFKLDHSIKGCFLDCIDWELNCHNLLVQRALMHSCWVIWHVCCKKTLCLFALFTNQVNKSLQTCHVKKKHMAVKID